MKQLADIHLSLWNYNQDNEDEIGDDWCGENFSWFSNSRARPVAKAASLAQTDASLDQGGRILRAVVRPYPAKIAGIPLDFEYNINDGSFSFAYANPVTENAPPTPKLAVIEKPPLKHGLVIRKQETEFFIPSMLAKGRKVVVTGDGVVEGQYEYVEDVQTLYLRHTNSTPGHVHRVRVALEPPLEPVIEFSTHWWDFKFIYSAFALFLAVLMAFICN